jgi:hypothetical protein
VLAGCLALLLAGPALRPQSTPSEPELAVVREVVAALAAADGPALARLVDFGLRTDERIVRGHATRPWEDLDELDRQLAQREAVEAWMAGAGSFLRAVSLVGARIVADPDAGRGPVPDRRIVQARLRRLVGGEHRDMLVVLTPDARVLDLVFGRPYFADANPEGEAGLLPRAELMRPEEPAVRWPDGVDAFERGKLVELVDRLLALPEGYERDLVVEQLHRSPRQAAAALLERLVALDEAGAEVEPIARLDAVLSHITGRPSSARLAPRRGQDLAQLREANSAAVAGWLRWQAANGTRFVATEIVPPLDPTVAERSGSSASAPLARWDEALRARESGAGLSAPREDPPAPAEAPPAPEPPPLEPPAAPPTAPPEAPPGAPVTAPPPAPVSGPSIGTGRLPPERELLFPTAAGTRLSFGGRVGEARDVEEQLTPALKEALNDWADTARALQLEILVADPPESNLVVLARAPKGVAREAATIMGRTHELLDGVLPPVGPDTATAVVAVVLDEDGVADAWRTLLATLVERRLLLGNQADRLAADPQGVLLRKSALFLQPTWDIAGEGEFALGNEIAHKTAQCLATERAGELPANLLWGLGELAELRLYGTVYQFNTTGFVATADHFDWPQRTRQHVENRYRKARFAFSALVLDDAQAGTASLPQMVSWGLLAHLADKDAPTLRALLADLGALHAEADRSGRATLYRGDADRTRALLEQRLDALDPERLMTWLRNQR